MASTIIEFPFNSGAYEAADREWLPSNFLAVVENMRLDLDGRLGVRPGFTALGTSTYSANALVAYDLVNYNGKLLALGDQTGAGRPTDLFALVNQAGVWRGLAGDDSTSGTGPRLPRTTSVRDIGRVAELSDTLQTVHIATNGTALCAVAQTQNSRAMISVFKPDTDQFFLLATVPLLRARVLFAGSVFWIIGVNPANDDIVGYQFNPSTGKALVSLTPTTLRALGATTMNDLAVAATGASDFTIAYVQNGGNVFAERFNSAGVTQANWTAFASTSKAVGVCGNAAGTLISVGRNVESTGAYEFSTFNAAGALQTGPTALFLGSSMSAGIKVSGRYSFGMVQSGSQVAFVGVCDIDWLFGTLTPEAETFHQVCTNQSTHALSTPTNYRNSFPQTIPVPVSGGGFSGFDFYYGAIDYATALNGGPGTNQLVGFERREPQVFKDTGLGPPITNFAATNHIGGSCTIGTKIYWCNLQRANNTGTSGGDSITYAVTEVEMKDTGRRQIAQAVNELHIAGGLPMVYDGQYMVEQGFAERPQVIQLTEAAGGSKTLLGVYKVRCTWVATDARGNTVRSQVSGTLRDIFGTGPETVTLTGANQSITALLTAPHSLRTHPLLQNQGGYSVRLEVYCTTAGGANFFLDKVVHIDPLVVDYAAPITVTLTQSDTQLRDNQVLYTQEQTPLPHVSPQPYRYSWSARERQIIGGLPAPEQWTFSKLLFPAEPVEFAAPGQLGFSGRANQDITGVAAFETTSLVFTKSEIGEVAGRGPEQNGTGDFDPFTLVPSPGGCIDWRSLVSTPEGLFFQMLKEKLMILRRGSQQGAPRVEWIGAPIQQTLALFPTIVAAQYVRSQSQIIVAFAVQNVAGDAGRILIYDTKHDTWYVDTIGPVVALSELDGRLAYVLSGVVSLQDASPGAGTFPTCAVQSGFLPVTKRLGWGRIYKIGLLGSALGACQVEAFIDYDDGVGFRSLGIETFAGTEGQFERFWSLAIQKTARFSVRFVVSSASSNTLGLRLNAWAAEVEGSPNMARVGAGGQVA